MAERLPLFPLNAVLFPDMLMPLHIFEPRYRLLVRRSLEREQPFGLVLVREGGELGAGAQPHRVGTSARIVGHQPLPDGRSFIVIRGGRRFAIAGTLPDEEPYLVGEVEYLAEDEGADAGQLADAAAEAFTQYLMAVHAAADELRGDPPDLDGLREGSPRDVAYRLAAGLAVDSLERQRLLEAETTKDRLAGEVRLLERENALLRELLVRMRARGEGPRLH
ncbi:MAG: LON peptidase substrate-binding domain-containing protein [Candidatus Limnocylindria bacterium]